MPYVCGPAILKWLTSCRNQLALFICVGFMISLGMRCNLGFAVIQMTAHLNKHGGIPEYEWPSATIGLIHSSYFWGHLITNIPGGYISMRFPATRMFCIAIGLSSVLNMCIPVAADMHYACVIAIRVTQGAIEGVIVPANHGIWSHWAPPMERSRLIAISSTGYYSGPLIGMLFSGLMTEQFGWYSSFYLFGVMGICWSVFWWFLVADTPAEHVYISDEERHHIETSISEYENPKTNTKYCKPPWSKILTSLPVYSICIAYFCTNWSYVLLITEQANYFSEVLHFKISESAMLSSIPYLAVLIVIPVGGFIADYLRNNTRLTTTTVRKLFNCGGFTLEALFLIGVGISRDGISAMICLTLAVGLSGLTISGYNVNLLDIAPRYASLLMGVSNAFGTVAAMLTPLTTEALTPENTPRQWEHVFILASMVHFTGIVFYAVFASGEKQNRDEETEGQAPLEDAHDTNTNMSSSYGTLSVQ